MNKKLIFLLLGFFIWQSALSQGIKPGNYTATNPSTFLQLALTGPTNVSAINGRTYTASTVDTTQWYQVSNFKTLYISLQSKDSCTLLVNYQLSLDGTNVGVSTLIDSLSTAVNAGAVKVMDHTAQILGSTFVRWIFTGSALARPEGTTSNTYTAKYTFKNF